MKYEKIIIILILALLLFTCWSLWMTSEKTRELEPANPANEPADAAVGGDFTLIDQNGRPARPEDFHGRMMLVFFGFSHCPDICPVAVATLSKTMELLGPKADQVAPLFISVDPERDTPAALKDFLANFDKRLVGLTGAPAQIKQAAEAYKVYFAQAAPTAGGSADYMVDHSAFIYLMGKDGKFIRVFENSADAPEIARALQPYLE